MYTNNTTQSKSATPWILLGVFLAALLVIAVILFTRGLQAKPTGDLTAEQLADEYADKLPDRTREDILEELNTSLNDDAAAELNKNLDEIDANSLPELRSEEDIVRYTETGFIYIGADGQEHEFIETPETTWTEEELEEFNKNASDLEWLINQGQDYGNNADNPGTTASDEGPADPDLPGVSEDDVFVSFDDLEDVTSGFDPSLIDQDSESAPGNGGTLPDDFFN